ncbi:MAG: glutamate 5-kinase [Cytophagales bacterium]|nr:glutamate 5-kinase [Cytophagales bacterium]
MKVVVKVGTNVLTDDNGELDTKVIQSIVHQIAQLKEQGHIVVLVSSGAVGAGKSIHTLQDEIDETTQRQVYSALGQVKLMNLYSSYFADYGFYCAQVLATKDDFIGGEHYRNMKNCFHGLLEHNIIPIVNENDVVSLKELMFTDNDELAGLTAFMIQADTLLLLSNIDGFYTGNPTDEDSELIPEIIFEDESMRKYIQTAKSSGGRGGMESKFNTTQKMAKKGVTTYIAHGKKSNTILEIIEGKKVGTKFLPKTN